MTSFSCSRYSLTYFSARLKIKFRFRLYKRFLFNAEANDFAFNLAARCLRLRIDSGTDGNLAARPVFFGAATAGDLGFTAAGFAVLKSIKNVTTTLLTNQHT